MYPYNKILSIMRNLEQTFLAILLILATSVSSSSATDLMYNNIDPNSSIKFYSGSFDSAKTKAKGEGKLFFVDFYANWCTPCKWMEESTFKDPEVVNVMEASYVPYKVDIDEQEGYQLKKKYGVKLLPTILIFNKKGELVERVEETLDARKLTGLLKFHSENEVAGVSHQPNRSPSHGTQPSSDSEQLEELYKNYREKLERENRTFNAQIGNYANYQDASKFVSTIKKKFLEPIIVLADYQNGTTNYKVLLGQFSTIEEADSFVKILINDFGMSAIVH